MPQSTAYIRRTHPRWRVPVLIALVLSLLLGGTGMVAYAQVQGGERVFTNAPAQPESTVYTPTAAQGDWRVHATLAYSTLITALETLIPQQVAQLEWTDEFVPYWSLDRVEMALSATVQRQGPAQLTVFGQELEIIQPLQLTVTASTADVSESESRDFIMATRLGIDLDEDWNWQFIELEPARLLGFASPRLFGSLNPDLSQFEADLNTELAPLLLENLSAELNGAQGLRAQIIALSTNATLPPGAGFLGDPLDFVVVGGHVNEVRLNDEAIEARLTVSFAQAAQQSLGDQQTLPTLNLNPKAAETFQMPVAFTATMAEVAQNLARNERLLSIEGGELLVNKIRVLRPFGDALLVKVDAEQIDPGGHRFKKRGTFHILVQFSLHGPTQTIRVASASMPTAENQLSYALRGRDWLRSDSLALGLVSGLSGIPRQGQVVAYLNTLETALDTIPHLQAYDLGDVKFSPGQAVYSGDHVASYVYAQFQPQVYLAQ